MVPQPGDSLPGITVYEGTPDGTVNILEVFQGKKGILFGVPGAFTPGCSKTHLPGYVESYDKLKDAGVEVIVCTSVNDPFVMAAWGENQQVGDKVRMLADPRAELARALGVEVDATAVLGNVRTKRYSAIIEDGKVVEFFLEPDGFGMSCSLAGNALTALTK